MDLIEESIIIILFCLIELFAVWFGLKALNDLYPNFIEVTVLHVVDVWLILIAIGVCINNTPIKKG